jgi:hypothetical protein
VRTTTRTTGTTRARRLTAAGLALAVLALAGCGGDDEPTTAPTASPEPTTGATTEPAPTATDTPSTTPDPDEGYLPTPAGTSLTRPGARLDLRQDAVAAWLPRQDLVGVVELAVTRIEQTTVQASLAGFDLDGEAQRSTPYFVRAKVTNVGDTDLGERQLPLYFLDDQGGLVAPTGVAPDFEPCPGSVLPADFGPGDSTSSCLIFLVPPGAGLQAITFRPPEGVMPLQWRGAAQALGEAAPRDRGDGRDRGRDDDRDEGRDEDRGQRPRRGAS